MNKTQAKVKEHFHNNVPSNKDGTRNRIGKLNCAFWAGFDGLNVTRYEKDSLCAYAWKVGAAHKKA